MTGISWAAAAACAAWLTFSMSSGAPTAQIPDGVAARASSAAAAPGWPLALRKVAADSSGLPGKVYSRAELAYGSAPQAAAHRTVAAASTPSTHVRQLRLGGGW